MTLQKGSCWTRRDVELNYVSIPFRLSDSATAPHVDSKRRSKKPYLESLVNLRPISWTPRAFHVPGAASDLLGTLMLVGQMCLHT